MLVNNRSLDIYRVGLTELILTIFFCKLTTSMTDGFVKRPVHAFVRVANTVLPSRSNLLKRQSQNTFARRVKRAVR
ncbi:MAG: hypothetical protein F6J95_021220 [Leptolyngbya sp. SIO1E4]|nr:hypothetical protein [Leptolyngbya sp. SIO1E4]